MSALHIDQSLADRMVDDAIETCAVKVFSGDTNLTVEALCNGRCEVCALVTDQLARQVGAYLGEIDKTIRAIYRYDPEYTSIRQLGSERTGLSRRGGINLVTWVDRKSAAQSALGMMLETALSTSRQKIIKCHEASPAACTFARPRFGFALMWPNRSHQKRSSWTNAPEMACWQLMTLN